MKLTPKQKADNAAAAASVPAQAGGENGGMDGHVRQRLGPPDGLALSAFACAERMIMPGNRRN
jgi:hypothetical protein